MVGVVMCVHAANAFRVDLLAIATCSMECVDGFEPSNSFTSDEFCSQVSLEETLRTVRITGSPGGINNHPVIYTGPIRLC